MNKTNPTAGSRLRSGSIWRVRFTLVGYLTAVMTLCAPISPLQNPPLNLQSAEASSLALKQFAKMQSISVFKWDKSEVKCLNQLWGKESAWNPQADNPHSTAYGIAQMLNEKSPNPVTQISNGLVYIEHRYKKPCNAWAFWKRNNHY